MKEYFYEKDNKAYIIDDEKGIIVEDTKDNTEETLIVQNNIEEIEGQIEEANEEKEQNIRSQKICKTSCIIIRISSILGLPLIIYLKIFTGTNFIPVMICALLLIINTVLSISNYSNKTDIKFSEIYIKKLQEELEKENKKLKTLKEKAKAKIVESTIIKRVPKSEMIQDLERKKELIMKYFDRRRKYVSSYKNDTLDNLLQSNNYSQGDIQFIKYLIEEDLKNENINSKKKNKTKTL